MTSIVNFEERMKGASTLTDEFFASINRFSEAKMSGALKEDELSKLLILENKFFANLVRKGQKTEEDVENYENQMPNGEYSIGNFQHQELPLAKNTIKQTNTAALFDAETLSSRMQFSDSYPKGLKKVS